MNESIAGFLKSKSIAVVGVSSSRAKIGSLAYRALKKGGYDVYPVNSDMASFDGDKCYRSLSELPAHVKAAFVAVKPDHASRVPGEAAAAGIRHLWFQQGADFSSLARRASDNGLNVVTGRCLLMYAEPVKGIHRFHRYLSRLFGKY